MSHKIVCDYCLQEITAKYTVMRIQTVDPQDTTSASEEDEFEFHPTCFNILQGLIVQLRGAQTPPPLDLTPPPPKPQPTNPNDPTPEIPPIGS